MLKLVHLSVIGVVLMIALVARIDSCGLPSGGGGGCCCSSCCGGGGGGGCCGGRRKRQIQAIIFQYKTEATAPCPQTAWKRVMEEGIAADDAVSSVHRIQEKLNAKYPDSRFLVTCAVSAYGGVDRNQKSAALPNKVHFSAGGDGYCNAVRGLVWCQTIALAA